MTYGLLLMLLAPWALGLALSRALADERRSTTGSGELLAGAGLGLGLGLFSLAAYLTLILQGSPERWRWMERAVIGPLGLALLALLALLYLRSTRAGRREGGRPGLTTRLFGLGVALAAAATVVGLVQRFARQPHGQWDAWAIWNLHARFMHRDPVGGLGRMTDPALGWSHPDYPLLLPLLVVRGWLLSGVEHPLVPALLGGAFLLATALTLHGGLRRLQDRLTAQVGLLTLLATPLATDHAVSQYADLPLACLLLVAVIAIYLALQRRRARIMALAGLAAGLAAWTKNEGLLLAAALLLVQLLALIRAAPHDRLHTAHQLGWLLLGLLPGLAAVLSLRQHLGLSTDLLVGAGGRAGQLLSPGRWAALLAALASHALHLGRGLLSPLALLLYLVVLGRDGRPRPAVRAASARAGTLLALQLGGYALAYLLTPHDLAWQLRTSLDRLLLHLWPAAILWALTVARPAGDHVEAARSGVSRGSRR